MWSFSSFQNWDNKNFCCLSHSENEDHGIWSHHFMGNRWGNSGNSVRLYFGGLQKSLWMLIAAMKWKDACSLEESYDQPRQHIQKQRHYFANKGPSSSRLWFFLWSCMDVRVGLWRRLSAEELILLNCGVGEDSWVSLGLQGDPTSPFGRRSALGFLWKEWC